MSIARMADRYLGLAGDFEPDDPVCLVSVMPPGVGQCVHDPQPSASVAGEVDVPGWDGGYGLAARVVDLDPHGMPGD
jgi:hypothetical protein